MAMCDLNCVHNGICAKLYKAGLEEDRIRELMGECRYNIIIEHCRLQAPVLDRDYDSETSTIEFRPFTKSCDTCYNLIEDWVSLATGEEGLWCPFCLKIVENPVGSWSRIDGKPVTNRDYAKSRAERKAKIYE